ncbi:MAG: hypothetical protein ACK5LF_16005, partial [Bacteroides xylanisolvens]
KYTPEPTDEDHEYELKKRNISNQHRCNADLSPNQEDITQEKLDALDKEYRKGVYAPKARTIPDANTVCCFHPIAFVEQMKRMGGESLSLKRAKEIALKVSSAYEGRDSSYSALGGNFDGMGMSWGIIQFNFGQNSLGSLLQKMQTNNEQKFNACFSKEEHLLSLKEVLSKTTKDQIDWAVDMQKNFNSDWKEIFNNLANIDEFQEIQLQAVEIYDNTAIDIINWMKNKYPDLMNDVELTTFVALHDLAIQQGSISKAKKAIDERCKTNPPRTQKEFIQIIAEERGATAVPKYRADCISRRLGILNQKATEITHSGYTAKRANKNFNLIKDVYVLFMLVFALLLGKFAYSQELETTNEYCYRYYKITEYNCGCTMQDNVYYIFNQIKHSLFKVSGVSDIYVKDQKLNTIDSLNIALVFLLKNKKICDNSLKSHNSELNFYTLVPNDNTQGCYEFSAFVDSVGDIVKQEDYVTIEKLNTITVDKQYLYNEADGCSSTKMYLIEGDIVEILQVNGDWLYVFYRGKKEIRKWIPKSAVGWDKR